MDYDKIKHPKWMYTLDFFFNKVWPKKFTVMVIATIFALPGITIITGLQWLLVAGAWAGLNFGQKLLRNNYGSISNTGNHGGDGSHGNRRVHLDAQESREAAESD